MSNAPLSCLSDRPVGVEVRQVVGSKSEANGHEGAEERSARLSASRNPAGEGRGGAQRPARSFGGRASSGDVKMDVEGPEGCAAAVRVRTHVVEGVARDDVKDPIACCGPGAGSVVRRLPPRSPISLGEFFPSGHGSDDTNRAGCEPLTRLKRGPEEQLGDDGGGRKAGRRRANVSRASVRGRRDVWPPWVLCGVQGGRNA